MNDFYLDVSPVNNSDSDSRHVEYLLAVVGVPFEPTCLLGAAPLGVSKLKRHPYEGVRYPHIHLGYKFGDL